MCHLHVAFHAKAVFIEHGEIELAVGETALGSLLEPSGSGGIVGRFIRLVCAQHRKIVHRLDVALLSSALIPCCRACPIRLHAKPTFVKSAKAILRLRDSVIG